MSEFENEPREDDEDVRELSDEALDAVSGGNIEYEGGELNP